MAKVSRTSGSMNKRSLADALASETGMAKSVAYEAVETLFDLCAKHVVEGGVVSITNFATMSRVTKDPRRVRNPQTGERLTLPARYAIKIAIAPRLNEFANSKTPGEVTIRKRPKGSSQK